jgi:hypothetical protein
METALHAHTCQFESIDSELHASTYLMDEDQESGVGTIRKAPISLIVRGKTKLVHFTQKQRIS